MTIQRLYEPDPEALERVVEILYRLLAKTPEGVVGFESDSTKPTCFSPEHE
jgi:hypothetical protein